jgi:hypothetical protein
MSIKTNILVCMAVFAVFTAPLRIGCCLSEFATPSQKQAKHACCMPAMAVASTPVASWTSQTSGPQKNCPYCNQGQLTKHIPNPDNTSTTSQTLTELIVSHLSPLSVTPYTLYPSRILVFSTPPTVPPTGSTLLAMNCQFQI